MASGLTTLPVLPSRTASAAWAQIGCSPLAYYCTLSPPLLPLPSPQSLPSLLSPSPISLYLFALPSPSSTPTVLSPCTSPSRSFSPPHPSSSSPLSHSPIVSRSIFTLKGMESFEDNVCRGCRGFCSRLTRDDRGREKLLYFGLEWEGFVLFPCSSVPWPRADCRRASLGHHPARAAERKSGHSSRQERGLCLHKQGQGKEGERGALGGRCVKGICFPALPFPAAPRGFAESTRPALRSTTRHASPPPRFLHAPPRPPPPPTRSLPPT